MQLKTLLPLIAVGVSAVAAYPPYSSYGNIYARDAEPDYDLTMDLYAREAEAEADYDDHLSHIYSRDLETRGLQIQDDMEAALRVRELAVRDPELFRLYARGDKTNALLAAAGGAVLSKSMGHSGLAGAAGGVAAKYAYDHLGPHLH